MVRAADVADDFTFIMTCLKHTSGMPKPNFEEVAKELGAKGKNACYHRHWAIMRKWGLKGTSGKRRRAGTKLTSDSGNKRGRATLKDATEDGDEQDKLGDSEDSLRETKAKVAAPADVKETSEFETDELE